MKQRRAHHMRGQPEIGDDGGDGKTVGDVGVPTAALLALVPEGSLGIGAFHRCGVGRGMVCPDNGEQTVEGRRLACPHQVARS